jgi:hypothetical protein
MKRCWQEEAVQVVASKGSKKKVQSRQPIQEHSLLHFLSFVSLSFNRVPSLNLTVEHSKAALE